MTKVAIYVRLSEEDRDKITDEQDSDSIINQKNLLIDYVKQREWEIYDIYSDDDYSGSDETRPDFNRMIVDAQAQKFQVVLCKTLSRFARDVAMVERYINGKFIEWGIRFISLADYADSFQKGSKKNIQINSLVNQWYLEDMSENIKTVLNYNKKQGKFMGSIAPYGYIKHTNDKHQLIIDEEAADIVKKIFTLYLKGHGIYDIANILNNDGVLYPNAYKAQKGIIKKDTNKNKMWRGTTINSILDNSNYTGDLTQSKYKKATYKSKLKKTSEDEWITVQNTHEAIISKNDFNKVQEIKKQRGSAYKIQNEGRRENLFKGLLRCAECDYALTVAYNKKVSNGLIAYFACSGKLHKITKCNCAMINQENLKAIIFREIKSIIEKYCDYELLPDKVNTVENHYKEELSKIEKKVAENKIGIEKNKEILSNAYIDKVSGLLAIDEYQIIVDKLRENNDKLTMQNSNLKDKINIIKEKIENTSRKNYIIEKYKNLSELSREILEAFIEVIYVGESTGRANKNKENAEYNLEIVWKI